MSKPVYSIKLITDARLTLTEDEHVLPAEEQPLSPAVSPTSKSPGYVTKSNPEEDPEEYQDDESEDGLVDYPIDGGDDGDDDDGDSSRDDVKDKDEDEEEEEEDEHLASTDFAVFIPTVELVSPPKGTEPVIPLPSTDTTAIGSRITALIDAVTATLPSPPLPSLPPSLYIPLPVDHRDDILETVMPPRKRSCLFALGCRYDIGESSTARPTRSRGIDYGFFSTIDAKARRRGIREVGYGICTRVLAPGTSDTTTVARRIMAYVTRKGPNIPPNNINPNNITPESVQAMINQALLRNFTNRDESHSLHKDNRRNVQTARPCFYADFMKCRPLNFKGTEGMVKFATCTMLDAALTWWNGQIRSLGPDAYSITWEVLKKKIMDKYCSQGEIKKLKIKLWNLKVKGNNVPTYTKRFQELTLICTKFFANETEKVDKYISGLPDNIYGSVKSSKPKTLDETIELANDFMDQKLRTYAGRQTNNKMNADDLSRNNHGHQQQPAKRKNVAKFYNMGSSEKKPYGGSLPKAIPKGNGCFKCGALGHFKRDCPKLKNKDGGNVNAQGWVYVVGNAEKKECIEGPGLQCSHG
nr:hypothetical protein [Tanacetum cinerariifolium]